MTHDERVTGLINANSVNVIKRRALAGFIREIRDMLPHGIIQTRVDKILRDNGP